MSLITPPIFGSTPGLVDLDDRARDIFTRVVESYIQSGEPVGSRTLSRSGLGLSAASIRNTMQDLTELGLLNAPHVSAGRMPTHAGLRLFVDGLMEVGEVAASDRDQIDAKLSDHRGTVEDLLSEASGLLSSLVKGASLVVAPVREAGVRHVDFVSISPERALVVIVLEDGSIENRIMHLSPGVMPESLSQASRFLNSQLRGRTLAAARNDIGDDVEKARRELDSVAALLVEQGLAAWSGEADEHARTLIVRGQANLIDSDMMVDLERARQLFDDIENKEQLIGLLDGVGRAESVRIFIGAETRLFSLSGSAVIAAPYMSGNQRVLGAIGVIGPARLNYARIIPLVDYTARVIGRRIDG